MAFDALHQGYFSEHEEHNMGLRRIYVTHDLMIQYSACLWSTFLGSSAPRILTFAGGKIVSDSERLEDDPCLL